MYGALTLYGRSFQDRSTTSCESRMQSEPRGARTTVWALPRSLAATYGIDLSFSSSGYLDVSVHRVPFHTLWIGVWMAGVLPAGFPHSDICGSNGYLLLTAAFRSLSRLSSALSAKASTLRSSLHKLSCASVHTLSDKFRLLKFSERLGSRLIRIVLISLLMS